MRDLLDGWRIIGGGTFNDELLCTLAKVACESVASDALKVGMHLSIRGQRMLQGRLGCCRSMSMMPLTPTKSGWRLPDFWTASRWDVVLSSQV